MGAVEFERGAFHEACDATISESAPAALIVILNPVLKTGDGEEVLRQSAGFHRTEVRNDAFCNYESLLRFRTDPVEDTPAKGEVGQIGGNAFQVADWLLSAQLLVF